MSADAAAVSGVGQYETVVATVPHPKDVWEGSPKAFVGASTYVTH